VTGEVQQNVAPRPFKWTAPKRRAVEMLASDEVPDAGIAAAVSVNRATLLRWKSHPEFAAAVREAVAALGEAARRHAVGRRAARVKALDDRRHTLQRVIAERAAAPEMQGVPGGTTGHLCRTVKGIGSGETFQVVEEFEVDTGLLRELREHEKQAAQELGQWADKHVVEGPRGESPFPPWEDLVRLPREDLLRLYEERRRLAEGQPRG
jgi:hypothetical protein